MVNLDEPPFLSVGTEVSAKFKGAFCEAKIRKIFKSVKCKVQYSNGKAKFVTDDAVKGQLKVGATVNVKCSGKKELVPATIQKIQDCSQYIVVFNDGDIKCLKRTAICLKSGKHSADSATLLRTTKMESCGVQTHKKSIWESGVEEASAMEEKDELPPHWDKVSLFGVHKLCIATDCEPIDSDNSDKESIEEKDHLVALLFKFMDDRGTPIDQAPLINGKDVDLYKLFKVVNNCGGYNKVNKGELWKFVAYKAGHEKESFFSVKHCYQQYLHNFENFYRKLGCTMVSHPRGERSRSRFSRSIIRDVDKALPSIATDKIKCIKNELNDKKNEKSAVIKTTAEAVKAEEKCVKNNEETSKKGDKKKEDIAITTSLNKLSVKWDPEITETKDQVGSSKTKKETEGILKKEIKKEIDSEAVDDDQIIEDKKMKQKFYLFGKSMQKIIKNEIVVKENANTGLPGMRETRGIKKQIKTVVKEIITPFKKSKKRVSYTEQDTSNNGELDDEISKFTRSKTKEELPTKSRRVSVLSNLGDSVSVVQLTQPGLLVENLIKIKEENGSEKKKSGRKKKDNKEEKVFSNNIILTPVNIENVPFDKDTSVVVGDNLVVYYGNKEATTYDAKVISVCDIEGVKKYYVHYKGWNSRYDEWIDAMRIAYKTKDPEPGLEVDNADSSKSSPPEQKNVDLKKVPLTSSKTRSSVTPLTPNSNVKKSPFSSARPTRTCTLTDRPLYNIDNSDLEGKYTVSEGSYKQYSIKKVIKSEPDVIIKTEPLDTDDQEKTQYPIIYPSKKVLMQRSAHLKPKSSVFKVHSSKFNEVDVCQQVILEQPFEPPSYSTKPNADNENIEAQNENKIEGIQIGLKIAPNHCLSPKVKSKNNDPEHWKIINEIENPIMINQSDNDSNEFQNSISEGFMVNTPNINEIEQHFQYVSDSKYEVLDLCMKPPESPPTNIFSVPEHYESNDMIVEGNDDEDYDESKLVNAENYKIEIDYQKDSDLVVISEKHNSSNVQIDKNIESQSLPLLRPYKHTNIEIDYKSSSHVKRDISIPKDTDDQSTAYCNKSFQYALVQRNHSSQNRLYMDNNDENTKSCFEFYPNSKPPSIEVREVIAEPSINDKPKTCNFVVKNVKDKYDKEKTMVLPELQCREEIEDKDTLNNVLNIEYNCKSAEHDIYKPSTSKGFFDSIYQPGTSKNSFYVADTSSDAKNSFFEASQAVKNFIFDTNVHGKSSLFDPNIPSCSTKDFYDHNIPSTSKSNFYENSLPSTSKSVNNSEYDVNSFLICEETIPVSPTGKSEEQYEQGRKKALQTLYEEREAASAMYAMNQSFCRPMITLMGATKEEMEEYTNILKKDGAILDQQHLLFLAEVSSKKLGININEPSVTELLEREPETIVQKIAKPQENLQFKRKISHEQTSKRSKLSTATAPIPSVSRVEEPDEEEKEWKSLHVIPVFPPEIKTTQRQAVLLDMMNNLKKEYSILKDRLVVVGRRKKKIEKRKRKQAKAARQAASGESQ